MKDTNENQTQGEELHREFFSNVLSLYQRTKKNVFNAFITDYLDYLNAVNKSLNATIKKNNEIAAKKSLLTHRLKAIKNTQEINEDKKMMDLLLYIEQDINNVCPELIKSLEVDNDTLTNFIDRLKSEKEIKDTLYVPVQKWAPAENLLKLAQIAFDSQKYVETILKLTEANDQLASVSTNTAKSDPRLSKIPLSREISSEIKAISNAIDELFLKAYEEYTKVLRSEEKYDEYVENLNCMLSILNKKDAKNNTIESRFSVYQAHMKLTDAHEILGDEENKNYHRELAQNVAQEITKHIINESSKYTTIATSLLEPKKPNLNMIMGQFYAGFSIIENNIKINDPLLINKKLEIAQCVSVLVKHHEYFGENMEVSKFICDMTSIYAYYLNSNNNKDSIEYYFLALSACDECIKQCMSSEIIDRALYWNLLIKKAAILEQRSLAYIKAEAFSEAMKDKRTAVKILEELPSDEEMEALKEKHKLSLADFQYVQFNDLLYDDSSEEADEYDINNNKRKIDNETNDDSNKRRKLTDEITTIRAEILTNPEEVLSMVEELDADAAPRFIKYYQTQLAYHHLSEKFANQLYAMNYNEVLCYSLPYFTNDITHFDRNHICTLIAKLESVAVPKKIIIHMQILLAAFDYHQATNNDQPADQKTAQLELSKYFLERDKLSDKKFLTINLSNLNLIDIELINLNLEKVIFKNTNLSFANLSKSNLNESQLDGANLYNANLTKVSAGFASMINCNLQYAVLEQSDLSHADLSEADLSEAIANFTNFSTTHLNSTVMRNIQIIRTEKEEDFKAKLLTFLKDHASHPQRNLLFKSAINNMMEKLREDKDTQTLRFAQITYELFVNFLQNERISNCNNNNVDTSRMFKQERVDRRLLKLKTLIETIESEILIENQQKKI